MDTLEIHPLPHPVPQIRRAGFDLTHPYVEQCWSARLGPSAVSILRRMPTLWTEQVPARMPAGELAESLGLGRGGGAHSRFYRSLDRISRFQLGVWIDEGSSIGIYTEVGPLNAVRLERLPGWTQAAHHRLLGEHLDRLAEPNAPSAAVADITARLDRLQDPNAARLPPNQALGQ